MIFGLLLAFLIVIGVVYGKGFSLRIEHHHVGGDFSALLRGFLGGSSTIFRRTSALIRRFLQRDEELHLGREWWGEEL